MLFCDIEKKSCENSIYLLLKGFISEVPKASVATLIILSYLSEYIANIFKLLKNCLLEKLFSST